MSVGERITLIIEDVCKIKHGEFASKILVSKQTLSNILTNHTQLSIDKMIAIKKAYPNIDLNWLVMGDGEMLLGEHAQPQSTTPKEKAISNDPEIAALRAIIQNYEVHIAALQATISDKNKIIALLEGSGARQSK
jgi:antitoxin component HigA of HigAB toxin-antitoxin module